MEGEALIHKTGMEKYVADGNAVVEFKLIKSVEDLENKSLVFHPEMCHQIFGDGETIFGYENLSIRIYFTAGSLKPFVGIKYASKVDAAKCDGVDADNIVEKINTVVPQEDYLVNLDDFSACIEKESSFRPFGELLHSFCKSIPKAKPAKAEQNGFGATNGNDSEESTFEIYTCSSATPKFGTYLKRMEAFVLWFIDAASFIDPDDEKWIFFVMYEKYKTSDGNTRYAFVGYSTVYNFYAYPENIRPRIAQMLILPPFQKQGLAVELMSMIYRRYRTDKKAIEITVEDPSDDCEVLRDYVDARDCMKLLAFADENLRKGYSAEMTEQAKKELKITKRQARRIYEILRLRVTDAENEEEFQPYRLEVKQRLNIPYQKQESDIKRMMRRKVNCTELQSVAQVDDATRKTELESNFQNLYSHYNVIIRRLEKHATSA